MLLDVVDPLKLLEVVKSNRLLQHGVPLSRHVFYEHGRLVPLGWNILVIATLHARDSHSQI